MNNKRLQTILETAENLMEYYAPDHDYTFDRSKIPRTPDQYQVPIIRPGGYRPKIDGSGYLPMPPSTPKRPGIGIEPKWPYNPRSGFERYRPEPTPDIGPYKPFSRYRPEPTPDIGPYKPFSRYRPEPTPDIGPYKPFSKIPSTPKRPGIGIEPKWPYNPRPGFEPYRPEPTPDIGPYKPFSKIPSTPKRPGIGIEPKWPEEGIGKGISDAERRRRSEQFRKPYT